VTVLQEGSTSCSQGRTQSAPTGALEQKKSRHGCSGREQWQHHSQALPATPRSPKYSGDLLPYRPLTSRTMGSCLSTVLSTDSPSSHSY
jgi:hypothetical protein